MMCERGLELFICGRGRRTGRERTLHFFNAQRTGFCSEPAYGDAASLSNEASRDPDSATPSRLYIVRPSCRTVLLPDDVPPGCVQQARRGGSNFNIITPSYFMETYGVRCGLVESWKCARYMFAYLDKQLGREHRKAREIRG